ncbi:MAG: homoserine kinase [Christensenellales bacterium]|jgi:homoserine kinase
MYRIMVPATTANLGAGFDCFGLALRTYNTVEFETASAGLHIEVTGMKGIPTDERNMLYGAIQQTLGTLGIKMPGLRIRQQNDIPTTKGLGSSAACRVAGIMAANIIAKEVLSKDEMINLATEMEGHPDNVTPAILGGFTIACCERNGVTHLKTITQQRLKCAVFIPPFSLQTKKARFVLPDRVSRRDAVDNISRASIFAVALATGHYEHLRAGVQDVLHQPYRKQFIPLFDAVAEKAYSLGARAVFISGAGPATAALIDGNYEAFAQGMHAFFEEKSSGWQVKILDICQQGAHFTQL